MRKAKKKGKLKRPTKWLYPTNLEKKYNRLLVKLTRELSKAINEILVPLIPSMLSDVETTYPVVDSRNDDFLDILHGAILSIEEFINTKVEKTILEMNQIGYEISSFNQEQFQKKNRSVFGFDIFAEQPFLQDQLELFSSQNAQLITSLPEQDLLQISGIVERGLQEGQRFTEVAKEIQKRSGITRRRANLIARDQTAKLNSSLTQLRDQTLGIDTFEWQTSGDERVRASHKIMDGKTCKYSDPTVWLDKKTNKWVKRPNTATKKNVGQDVNCRCVSLGIVEDDF